MHTATTTGQNDVSQHFLLVACVNLWFLSAVAEIFYFPMLKTFHVLERQTPLSSCF